MKRILVVTLLVVGLAAVAGSMSVNRHRMVADGNPPPPFPPYPASITILIADGNPPPPFPPYPPLYLMYLTESSTTA